MKPFQVGINYSDWNPLNIGKSPEILGSLPGGEGNEEEALLERKQILYTLLPPIII